MDRKRNIIVRDFFNREENNNKNVCKICSSKFIGDNTTNLKRHLLSMHNKFYEDEIKKRR